MNSILEYISVRSGKSYELLDKKSWLKIEFDRRMELVFDPETSFIDSEGVIYTRKDALVHARLEGWMDFIEEGLKSGVIIKYISIRDGHSFNIINKATWMNLPVHKRIELLLDRDSNTIDDSGRVIFGKERLELLKEQGWMEVKKL